MVVREDVTIDQFIDVVEGNRKYMPALYVMNKIDQVMNVALGCVYNATNMHNTMYVYIYLISCAGKTNVRFHTTRKNLVFFSKEVKRCTTTADFKGRLFIHASMEPVMVIAELKSNSADPEHRPFGVV